MRRAAWGVLVLTISACAQQARPQAQAPAPSPTPSPIANEVTAIWDVERADPASRDVALTFLAAACSAVRKVDVRETKERVTITLGAGTSAGRECTDPLLRHRTVRLASPLGTRDLYDGGASPAALVRAGR
jgi:hypothetical protein